MSKLTKYCTEKLNSVELRSLFRGLEGSGMTLNGKCPLCGAEGKKKSKWQGLWVKDDPLRNAHMCGCNSCKEKAGGGAINVVMKFYRLEFLPACEFIAKESGIELEFEEDTRFNTPSKPPAKESFCASQLKESGLTIDDILVSAHDENGSYKISPFRPGYLDIVSGTVDEKGDDMLILYYDLEGRRLTCTPAKFKSRQVPYTRARWAFPESHLDKSGKAIKYQTIWGAKSTIYIPEKIRALYKSKSKIKTLFIQEGEKKAEKACKHNIPSVAIQGIGLIGRKEEGLPMEIQLLVKRCGIENIVMVMDSDWTDLNRNLADDCRVDERPRDFARALIKFKKFIMTLNASGLNVDVWFAHVNKNKMGDKGIDDILCNTLKGREDILRESIDEAMTAVDGKSEYVDAENITSWSDQKIMNLWLLNSSEDFFLRHRDSLLTLHSFKFGDVFYNVENQRFVVASDIGSGKDFWVVKVDDKGRKKIDLDLIHLLDFLQTNGFRMQELEGSGYSFVKIDSGIIRPCSEVAIRKYVRNFVDRAVRSHEIKLFVAENISTKLSVTNLCLLDELQTAAGQKLQSSQKFYFKNVEVDITSKGLEVSKFIGPVWEQNLINRKFERIPVIREFKPDGEGSFLILPTPEGEQCEFFQFICNTSKERRKTSMTMKDNANFRKHIANKMTCLGYLLRDYRNRTEDKAVVAMDAKISEVGKSHGRTGKSFVGVAISKFISQKFIGGRKLKNDDDFTFTGVTRQHANIFIDDIKENFCFGDFYPSITGALDVNIKQGGRFSIEYENAPKFYITTNHALEGLDDSAEARLAFMSFSDWYSKNFSPADEFGHYFFDGWDEYQWCLFDNFMLECLMFYMRSFENGWRKSFEGVIDPPMENIKLRQLRQEMGELFLSWAELYFAPEGNNLNNRIVRKDMYNAFLSEFDTKSTQMTSRTFSAKIKAFCSYKGYNFNAHKPNENKITLDAWVKDNPNESFIGSRDISGSTEYFTISTKDFKYVQIF